MVYSALLIHNLSQVTIPAPSTPRKSKLRIIIDHNANIEYLTSILSQSRLNLNLSISILP